MRLPAFSPDIDFKLDLRSIKFTDSVSDQTKELNYYDASTDFVDFTGGEVVESRFKIVQLEKDLYAGLFNYLENFVGRPIPIEVEDGEDVLGAGVSGATVVTLVNATPESEQAVTVEQNTFSITLEVVQLVDNPAVASWDFVTEVELNAWSVDEIVEGAVVFPTGKPVGYTVYFRGATILPFAVHTGGEVWAPFVSLKPYEVTYWDFNRVGEPSFNGKNVGETAYSGGGNYGGVYYVWDGSLWQATSYPQISPFKPVILNSDLAGLHNSKFYWSSFSLVPIDNSDVLSLKPANYIAGVISRKGIKFPSWSVALEKGVGIERLQGFNFTLENAQRLNLLTKEINFFGAFCKLGVWDGTTSQVNFIRAGINKTNGYAFNGFNFEVDPELWNDAQKSIPAETMANILGDGGTKLSDRYIPQTYGEVQYAKLEVLKQDLEPVNVEGDVVFQIIEVLGYDATARAQSIKVAMGQSYSFESTHRLKLLGTDEVFEITGLAYDPTENTQQPDGAVSFAFARVSPTLSGEINVGQNIQIINNDVQLIVDDETLKGFGTSVRLYNYDSDKDEYVEVPEGLYEAVDDKTIRVGLGGTGLLVDDTGTALYGNAMLQLPSFNYGTFNRNTYEESSIDLTYGVFTGIPFRRKIDFDGGEFYNRPIIVDFLYTKVTGEVVINSSSILSLEQAQELSMGLLPTPEDSFIYQRRDLAERNGFFNIWQKDQRREVTVFNEDKIYNGNYDDPTAYRYLGSSGGKVQNYYSSKVKYVGGSTKLRIDDDPLNFRYNTRPPASTPTDIYTQYYPILSTTTLSLRGADEVRLLGSLYFEHYIQQSEVSVLSGSANGRDIYQSNIYGNVRVLVSLINAKQGNVPARTIIDKTFNVDNGDAVNAYKEWRTVPWGDGRYRHVFYNLPSTLGAVNNDWYSDVEDLEADYITIVYRPSALNKDPINDNTEVRTISGTGNGVGRTIYFWGAENRSSDINSNVCEANVLVLSGTFEVGDQIGTSFAQGIDGEILAIHKPKWWAGRDLFKLDPVDVEDLFRGDTYKFAEYDTVEIKFIPEYSQDTTGIKQGVSLGWGDPYTPLNENKVGLYFERSTELDLSDTDNLYVSVQGRTDEAGNLINTPEGIMREQLAQISPQSVLNVTESADRSNWQVRDQLVESRTLEECFIEYAKHIFGVVTFDDEGGYKSSSLDYQDYGLQPSDFIAEFNESNIIKGSLKKVVYRDVSEIHNEFVFNYNYSQGKGTTDRQLTLSYNDTDGLVIGGLGSDPTDSQELRLFKSSLRDTLKAELEDSFRVSRNFYNSGQISKKEVSLPMFYDEEVFNTTGDNFAVGSLVASAIKWAKYYLFNSWLVKFSVNMDKIITDGLRVGDLVSFQMDAITEDLKLFAFVRAIKPDFYNGKAEVTLFASVDPFVYQTFYDNVWDAGRVLDDYDSNEYRHTEYFRYPFRDPNQDGTFSDSGEIDGTYDEENYKFTDGSTADPDADFNPLP